MGISKYISLGASLVVGLTFLFSGAIKLNDPLGFAYKIEEYLHVLANQLTGHVRLLLPYTLALALLVATLEVVLGTALLVHGQCFWTVGALLLLTLFFTGLTLYTALSKQVACCGCFGDALDLTPWQSFGKSIVLLVLLGGLWWQTDREATTSLTSYYWMATALGLSLGLGWYSLCYLPPIDWLPYKVGTDLKQLAQARVPLRYVYVVEKDGQTLEIDHYPQEPGYKFLSVRLLNPEDVPTATHWSVWQGEKEQTQALLQGNQLLIVVQQPDAIPASTLQKLLALARQLPARLHPVLLAPQGQGQATAAALDLPLHTANPMLLRALLRAPLGLVYLQEGVVIRKWHYRDLARAHKALLDKP